MIPNEIFSVEWEVGKEFQREIYYNKQDAEESKIIWKQLHNDLEYKIKHYIRDDNGKYFAVVHYYGYVVDLYLSNERAEIQQIILSPEHTKIARYRLRNEGV